jgi:hypothetical protein
VPKSLLILKDHINIITLLFSNSLIPHSSLHEERGEVNNNFPPSQLHEEATITVMP